jgi:hypothetical protein
MNSGAIYELCYSPSPLVVVPSYPNSRENTYDLGKMENWKEIHGVGPSNHDTSWLSNY